MLASMGAVVVAARPKPFWRRCAPTGSDALQAGNSSLFTLCVHTADHRPESHRDRDHECPRKDLSEAEDDAV